jgi:hypothetical protein
VIFHKNIGTINDAKPLRNYTLVITDRVKYSSCDKTVKRLERLKNHPCTLYYISYDEHTKKWIIDKEKEIDKLSLRIPYNSFVLLMPSSYVKDVRCPYENGLEKDNYHIVYTPEIVLKKDIQNSTLCNAYNDILLGSLDSDTIHADEKESVTRTDNHIISIRQ